MLRWLILKNFKAFGGEERIPLAPLTLIFGRNSAGKSSILQSILFLKQSASSLASGGEAKWVGDDVDLGSMPHALHLQGKHPDHRTLSVGAIFGTWDWETGRCTDDPDNAPVGVEFTWGVRDVGVARQVIRPTMREAGREVRWAVYAGEDSVPALRGIVGEQRGAVSQIPTYRFKVTFPSDWQPFGSAHASLDPDASYLQSLYRVYQKPLEEAFQANLKAWKIVFEKARTSEREMALVAPLVAYWIDNVGGDVAVEALRALRWVEAEPRAAAAYSGEKSPIPAETAREIATTVRERAALRRVRNWFAKGYDRFFYVRPQAGMPDNLVEQMTTIFNSLAGRNDHNPETQSRYINDIRDLWAHQNIGADADELESASMAWFFNRSDDDEYFPPSIVNASVLESIIQYLSGFHGVFSNISLSLFIHEWNGINSRHAVGMPFLKPPERIRQYARATRIANLPRAIAGIEFQAPFEPTFKAVDKLGKFASSVRHVKAVREQLPRIAEATADPNSPRLLDRLVSHAGRLTGLNEWLQRLGINYAADVQPERIIASNESLPTLPRWSVTLAHKSNGTVLGMQDVGFGVGQVIPVAIEVAILGDGILLLEQPELHLHPAMQATVGEMLVEAVQASKTGQIIAETHSEHVVLRMMRLVREGKLSHTSLQILYVDQDSDGKSTVVELPLDKYGEFEADWPRGFFDERLNEL